MQLMQLSNIKGKISQYIKTPPFVLLERALRKVPFNPVEVEWLYVLKHTGVLTGSPSRGPGYIREAKLDDACEMAQLGSKLELFEQRFEEKEHAAVAVVDGKIVAYSWFSEKPFHFEDHHQYNLPIPPDSIYGYDLYIHPKYRMSGLWVKFMIYLADLMKKSGRVSIITMVEYGNFISMNTHIRFGFTPLRVVRIIKVLGSRMYMEKNI